MKKTLALLVALALFAAPVVAQGSPSETDGHWAQTLERVQEMPILGWLIGLATQDDKPKEMLEPPSPEAEDSSTLVLKQADENEARGVPDPWG